MSDRTACNALRYEGGRAGHYESYFLRANHPDRPLAFWIRYTLFSPRHRPQDAEGELWGVWFDGESGAHVSVKQDIPWSDTSWDDERLNVRIGSAHLGPSSLEGLARTGDRGIEWSLRYSSPQPPLLLFPERLYDTRLPRAKALVSSPQAVFEGELVVDGRKTSIEKWVGSQNHNWGSRHTDRYAWGQVAGFDDAPDVFLECATARIRLGPVWSPWMTLAVLRLGTKTFRFNTLRQSVRAASQYRFFDWRWTTGDRDCFLDVRLSAEPADFVGLPYRNPPGGMKTCLNSKIAAVDLTLARRGHPDLSLSTRHRGAFEILTDRSDHGVAVLQT